MRLASDPTTARRRIDRGFARGASRRPIASERVGTSPIDREGTFVSDHFGLAAAAAAAAVIRFSTPVGRRAMLRAAASADDADRARQQGER